MYRTKSAIPPSYWYRADRGWPASSRVRRSVREMARFLLRNAISCIRRDSVSNDQSVVSKIVLSGQKVIVVPVSSDVAPRSSGPIGSPRS